MNFQERANELHKKLVVSLTDIEDIPEGLLPHIVFVEEVNDEGVPEYKQYQLSKILPDGKCILTLPEINFSEERDLIEINLDWLNTVWNYYVDLSGIKELVEEELFAFLYPLKHFERNVTDNEILGGWTDGYVEKYTPDEFAELVNDKGFADQEYWVRFIKC